MGRTGFLQLRHYEVVVIPDNAVKGLLAPIIMEKTAKSLSVTIFRTHYTGALASVHAYWDF